MREIIFLVACLLLSTNLANAAEFKFNPGIYSSRDFYRIPRDESDKKYLKLLRRGNEIRVIDVKNNIVYSLDLANPGEQPIPDKVIEHMRNSNGSRVIGKLIERMTISDLNIPSENKLTGIINVYLKTSSVFGSINGKLQIGVEVKASTCEVTKVDGQASQLEKIQASCLKHETATDLKLASLNTGLSSELNTGLGLVSDFLLKLLSPMFSNSDSLYENR